MISCWCVDWTSSHWGGLKTGWTVWAHTVISVAKYGWRQETSGVCLGSILGPVLFNILINDLDDRSDCTFIRFACTKAEVLLTQYCEAWVIFRRVVPGSLDEPIPEGHLEETGWRNEMAGTSWSSARGSKKSCSWGGTTPDGRTYWGLEGGLTEKGIGGLVDIKLNLSHQCDFSANGILGFITRKIANRLR